MAGRPIQGFEDLEVFQNSYSASLIVMKEIVPRLPMNERYDLADQLSRSCKAIPRLIAEGYGKRHQKLGFHKYLEDAMSECNETIVSLMHTRDLYSTCVNSERCNHLIQVYKQTVKQVYRLAEVWQNFQGPRARANPNPASKPNPKPGCSP